MPCFDYSKTLLTLVIEHFYYESILYQSPFAALMKITVSELRFTIRILKEYFSNPIWVYRP